MEDFELEQLRKNPPWIAVLEAYLQLHLQSRNQLSDFDGWIPRVIDLSGIDTSALSGIHGKLIAFGFLKFDLAGRDGGIRYQLTPLGKQGICPAIDDSETDSVVSEGLESGFAPSRELVA